MPFAPSVRSDPFAPGEVEKIVVHGSQVTMDHVGWKYVPQGLTSAQLNLPYCVATLLLDGDCFVDQFTEAKVADPERMRVAGKVEVRHDAEITALGSKFRHMVRVQVFFRDGSVREGTVEAARGNEKDFASERDIVDKFVNLATHVVPRSQADAIAEWILGGWKSRRTRARYRACWCAKASLGAALTVAPTPCVAAPAWRAPRAARRAGSRAAAACVHEAPRARIDSRPAQRRPRRGGRWPWRARLVLHQHDASRRAAMRMVEKLRCAVSVTYIDCRYRVR